jgi:hypothetical protein
MPSHQPHSSSHTALNRLVLLLRLQSDTMWLPWRKNSRISPIARATTGEVMDFAQRQSFSPADKIGPVPDGVTRRALRQVLRELLDSEVNVGLQTLAFDTFRVWIGDELNAIDAKGELTPGSPAWDDDDAIAHWLHETVLRLYPESDYARAHRC